MAAESALIDLLVDTQTAEAVEAWDDGFPSIPPAQPSHDDPSGDCLPATKRARSSQSINQEAAAAARHLTSLGHGQLSAHSRPITYNSVEPHIAAIIRWLGTLSNDIEIHLQLPPALASLRGILNAILHQRVSTATWAAMILIEVGEAIEQLPWCIILMQWHYKTGDMTRTSWREWQARHGARGTTFVETMGALLTDVDHLPDDALPAAQEAAMRVVVHRHRGRRPRRRGTRPHGGSSTDTTAWATCITQHDRQHARRAVVRERATADDDSSACTASTCDTTGDATYVTLSFYLARGSDILRREQLRHLSPGEEPRCKALTNVLY